MQKLDTSYQALYRAWTTFKKGKKPTQAIDEFAYYLEANLEKLAGELTSHSYQHSSYKNIVVEEKKRRDLAVAKVRDRVVHRLLYDHLVDEFGKSFDSDVWSCRKGKGLHACIARTQKLLAKHKHSYVWRADIIKFFDNVNHNILLGCLRRKMTSDPVALGLCEKIISSHNVSAGKRGIPIGNLTSQIFANIYLNQLDRFIRHYLKPQAYIRYGDDFILFYPTRRSAYSALNEAKWFLQNRLNLLVNPKNDIVIPTAAGLKFLGHNIYADQVRIDRQSTRNVLCKVNHRNVASYKALYLSPATKNRLDWILLDKMFDTYY